MSFVAWLQGDAVKSVWLLLCCALTLTVFELTPAEKACLRVHPVITFHNENDWKPYNYTETDVGANQNHNTKAYEEGIKEL